MQQPFSTEPTWEERMAAAWEAGHAAHRSGLPLDGCPHRAGTPAEVEWTTGWHGRLVCRAGGMTRPTGRCRLASLYPEAAEAPRR